MPQRDDAWLRHQQQRFMRPDSARYLRPDAARFLIPGTNPADVYPALARKWAGQPRLPEGQGHGQYTFGRINVDAADADRPRVYITKPSQPATSDGDGDGDDDADADEEGDDDGVTSEGVDSSFSLGNFLENLLLAAGTGPGIGHNQGPPLDDPPRIPRTKPRRSPSTYYRTAASWLSRARSLQQFVAIAAFIALLLAVDWIVGKFDLIITYLDPPRTMEELQSAVDVPRAGTEVHHQAMEQNFSKRQNMTYAEINAPGNRVRIPTLKHYEITRWYRRPNPQFGGLSPRRYLADKPAEEHERVGREALILFGVLKP